MPKSTALPKEKQKLIDNQSLALPTNIAAMSDPGYASIHPMLQPALQTWRSGTRKHVSVYVWIKFTLTKSPQ